MFYTYVAFFFFSTVNYAVEAVCFSWLLFHKLIFPIFKRFGSVVMVNHCALVPLSACIS